VVPAIQSLIIHATQTKMRVYLLVVLGTLSLTTHATTTGMVSLSGSALATPSITTPANGINGMASLLGTSAPTPLPITSARTMREEYFYSIQSITLLIKTHVRAMNMGF